MLKLSRLEEDWYADGNHRRESERSVPLPVLRIGEEPASRRPNAFGIVKTTHDGCLRNKALLKPNQPAGRRQALAVHAVIFR